MLQMRAIDEAAIRAWLAEREKAMLSLLAEIVDIDSGSHQKAGVDAVGSRFAELFREWGIVAERIPAEKVGDVLRFANRSTNEATRPFLLMGHRDTVFPAGEAARRPFRVEGTRAYGPGVADMKAGLVMNAFVLGAFQELAPEVPVVALMTGDEEIGSQFSRPFIEREARMARAIFNAEPGRVSGNIVKARKGGLFFRFDVQGKAAHSGVNFTEGASAIGAAAHKIVALHALSRVNEGITVNVGLIGGGQSVNTTAPHAWGEIDTRYISADQRQDILASIEAVMNQIDVEGTTASFTLKSEFLPLTESSAGDALARHYLDTAGDLGLQIGAEFTGGCADSGFAANTGVPTICGVGPVGGKPHTAEEYIEFATVLERASILATTIARMAAA